MEYFAGHKNIHLIGIGGCSMSGLAMILAQRGFCVQGSDVVSSPFTERLEQLGMKVFIGQDAGNLDGVDLVIYSSAIKPENAERVGAQQRGIPQMERAQALGQISAGYATVLGVAGCHGKTTITSMLALIAEHGGVDATVHVGGYMDFLEGGTRTGAGEVFITEACEYVESFLALHPSIALIHNIDNDHLDYYKDMDHIVAAFRKFLGRLPENGLFLAGSDDVRVRELYLAHEGPKLSYGLRNADYIPVNIAYDAQGAAGFDLLYRGEFLGRITLHVPGAHNLMNALAAAVAALALGAPLQTVQSALADYRLTRRRFEYYGQKNGVAIYHDYAHHPSEIRAVLEAASRVARGTLYCVLQCNSYTRAKTLFLGDMSCFARADEVLVVDIFPGREKDDGSVHANDMVAALARSGVPARYLPTFEQVRDYLEENARPGDMALTLGSGDVYRQTNLLL